MTSRSLRPESISRSGSLKTFWRDIVVTLFLLTVACSTQISVAPVATRPTLSHSSATTSSSLPPETTASTTWFKTPTTKTASTPITTTSQPYQGWWDPKEVETAWGSVVEGLLTFRGSPTRSWYGRGPVPLMPEVLWRFPKEGNLCSLSTTGGRTTNWCGIGWTGQPAVWQTGGDTWLAVGAYDRGIHLLDTSTGSPAKKPFVTGDIVKGSLTVDPDGFPLIYSGSRDDAYFLFCR